ncbi:CapA family protein [Rhizobium sp. CG5]|uniref:CapA family protein n=1 Tax=Rhizobium sp. CG5 TaxID=2726076 RepID=UPI0020333B7A|nr:CapA family protein [Rhizobium sp. CG5]MCM2475513.1 CapA family protein [Rhizobium sp. CG5]
MPISIAVTGQILLHEPLDLTSRGAEAVRSFLAADVAVANLEATVETAGSWPTKTKTLHLASAAALASLRELGFHGLAHANNHAFDLGPPGMAATRRAAQAHGLALAGSGDTIDAAAAPAVVASPAGSLALFSVDLGPQPEIVYAAPDRAGIAPLRMHRTVTVTPADFHRLQQIIEALGDDRRSAARSAVGYQAQTDSGLDVFGTKVQQGDATGADWAPNAADLERLVAGIRNARLAGHLVGIALHNHHWDADWTQTPAWLTDLGRRLIDKGASFILGTGAPVMQPVTFYRERPIIPGLGNFVFHTRRPLTYDARGVDVWRSAAIRMQFDDTGSCTRLDALPIAVGRPALTDGKPEAPVPLGDADADQILKRLLPEGSGRPG